MPFFPLCFSKFMKEKKKELCCADRRLLSPLSFFPGLGDFVERGVGEREIFFCQTEKLPGRANFPTFLNFPIRLARFSPLILEKWQS